jgi:hypothetical protein
MNQNPNTSGPLLTFESFLATRKPEKVEEAKTPKEVAQAVSEASKEITTGNSQAAQ